MLAKALLLFNTNLARRALFAITLSLLFVALPASQVSGQLPDVCQAPENILANCNFDNGLDNWQTFIEDGGANFGWLQGGGECHAPLCPAAHIVTEGYFIGGLYQQVPVTAGKAYYANIIWLVFDSLSNDAAVNGAVGGIGRRIGLDPTGGTDSRSPNVVWSEDNWRNDCKICGVEQVAVTAQADVITVFLRLDDTWRVRAAEKGYAIPPSKDQFWIDDLGLKQVDGEVPAPVPQPTEPPAPTATPVPPPPTEAPVSTEEAVEVVTELAEEAPQAEAQAVIPTDQVVIEPDVSAEIEAVAEQLTVEPTEVAPPVENTVAPPPTLTPTNTPGPTATAVARLAPEPTPIPTRRRQTVPEPSTSGLSGEVLGIAGTTACVGGVLVVIMAIALAGLTWLYRLGWGRADPGNDTDFADHVEEIEVEIVE